MEFRKVIWGIRFLLYKFIFKKVGYIGYFGKPISILHPTGISIGNNVRIYPGARMECHDGGTIIIEDNVSIGQNVHITSGEKELIIKSGTTITGNVFITNMDHNYEDIYCSVLEQGYRSESTIIGENCFIGFSVGIQAGTKLGKHNVVGAHSLVRGNFKDYVVIAGTPAKVIKTFNCKTNRWEKKKNEY